MGPSDSESVVWRDYRRLDLLTTFVIRACLLFIALLWLDREMAEVVLTLLSRMSGVFGFSIAFGYFFYLALFIGGLHWEASRILGEVKSHGSRQKTATSLTLASFLGLFVCLYPRPEGSGWIPCGILAWVLIWLAVAAPGFVAHHWEPTRHGSASPRRLALLGMSAGAFVGWLYLLSPWVMKS